MPVAVVEATVMVMVELPEPGDGIDAGLKLMVTPVGWPVADKATAELNPPKLATPIVDVPLFPRPTVTEAGDPEMVKSGVVGASALIRLAPFGLPHPVTKS